MLPANAPRAVFLPGIRGDAYGGAGGRSLMLASQEHREQQRAAANHQHPRSHPPVSVGPGAALMALTGGTQAPPVAGYSWASRR